MDNLRLWHKFLQIIKPLVGPDNFKAYFLKTFLKSVDANNVVLNTSSAFIKESLDQKYKNLIEQTLSKLLDKKVVVSFIVKESPTEVEGPDEAFFQPQLTSIFQLNPKYTLENFVVGPTNNLAYAAAEAVAQNPGTSYNPLFIYGGTGVGKTHLMLGIGNAIKRKHPQFKVNYCSSEKFTNDYVEALQTRQFGAFRSRYRNVNILLIDDVQFFSGREGTQEEFFHTFNELSSKNSQIVITSDRPPYEIAKLEDRLKSRFQGGLMVDMQTPDFDTRVAILKNKCIEQRYLLDEASLNLIAASVETNARDLEGKLIQILQALKTKKMEPTSENISKLLGKKADTDLKNLTPKQVLIKVCEYFSIKQLDLIGPRRIKGLVLPRHLAMHILSEDLNLTVEKIGEIMGGRDHTTVMHGRDKIKRLIVENRDIQRILGEVKQNLSTSIQ
ncbi:MAG: chromosomal replication initiator protein DnaA [Candidatus Daviesbacteria bacterium]|nr:chromosomal replication initiator protein DnaA [Candidatus Daviesbacteria bacterium]